MLVCGLLKESAHQKVVNCKVNNKITTVLHKAIAMTVATSWN